MGLLCGVLILLNPMSVVVCFLWLVFVLRGTWKSAVGAFAAFFVAIVLVCLLIAAWGVLEYSRRADAHRQKMSLLQRAMPPDETTPRAKPYRVVTTALVSLFLALFITTLLFAGWRSGTNAGPALRMFGFAFVPSLLVLLLMAIRDARALIRLRRAKEAA
jgi:hypothetical protein